MPKLSSSVTKDFRFHLVPETGKRSIRNVTGECFNVIVNSILIYHSAVSSIWSAVAKCGGGCADWGRSIICSLTKQS